MDSYQPPNSIWRLFLNAQPHAKEMIAHARHYDDTKILSFKRRLMWNLVDPRFKRPAKHWLKNPYIVKE